MSIDVIDAAAAVDFSNPFSQEEQNESKSVHFHSKIFSPPYYPVDFSRKAEPGQPKPQEAQKTNELAANKLDSKVARHRDRDRDQDREASASGEAGAKLSWGDGDGLKVDFYMRGEAHDNQGNYVEVEATQSTDGQGSLDVHGGTSTDSDADSN